MAVIDTNNLKNIFSSNSNTLFDHHDIENTIDYAITVDHTIENISADLKSAFKSWGLDGTMMEKGVMAIIAKYCGDKTNE